METRRQLRHEAMLRSRIVFCEIAGTTTDVEHDGDAYLLARRSVDSRPQDVPMSHWHTPVQVDDDVEGIPSGGDCPFDSMCLLFHGCLVGIGNTYPNVAELLQGMD